MLSSNKIENQQKHFKFDRESSVQVSITNNQNNQQNDEQDNVIYSKQLSSYPITKITQNNHYNEDKILIIESNKKNQIYCLFLDGTILTIKLDMEGFFRSNSGDSYYTLPYLSSNMFQSYNKRNNRKFLLSSNAMLLLKVFDNSSSIDNDDYNLNDTSEINNNKNNHSNYNDNDGNFMSNENNLEIPPLTGRSSVADEENIMKWEDTEESYPDNEEYSLVSTSDERKNIIVTSNDANNNNISSNNDSNSKNCSINVNDHDVNSNTENNSFVSNEDYFSYTYSNSIEDQNISNALIHIVNTLSCPWKLNLCNTGIGRVIDF